MYDAIRRAVDELSEAQQRSPWSRTWRIEWHQANGQDFPLAVITTPGGEIVVGWFGEWRWAVRSTGEEGDAESAVDAERRACWALLERTKRAVPA